MISFPSKFFMLKFTLPDLMMNIESATMFSTKIGVPAGMFRSWHIDSTTARPESEKPRNKLHDFSTFLLDIDYFITKLGHIGQGKIHPEDLLKRRFRQKAVLGLQSAFYVVYISTPDGNRGYVLVSFMLFWHADCYIAVDIFFKLDQ